MNNTIRPTQSAIAKCFSEPEYLKKAFDTPWETEYWMNSNGFFCGLNMPEAKKSAILGDEEIPSTLPESRGRRAFLVDEYPACPAQWMKSQGRSTSYFVPVQLNKGLWLDFNKNRQHTHDIAIVVSIQGINAITGLTCESPALEQYIDNCPKCKKPFGPNRYCDGCGYVWPKQNYISTTSTPDHYLWLDGFRAADGIIRQYLIEEEKMKGVANNIIGKDRVFAIGISFFISKNKKAINPNIAPNNAIIYTSHNPINWDLTTSEESSGVIMDWLVDYSSGSSSTSTVGCRRGAVPDGIKDSNFKKLVSTTSTTSINCCNSSGIDNVLSKKTFSSAMAIAPVAASVSEVNCKSAEIAAGAKIIQEIHEDQESLDYWQDEPSAILCINYALEEDVIKIIQQGKIDKVGHKEAFLKNIKTGN